MNYDVTWWLAPTCIWPWMLAIDVLNSRREQNKQQPVVYSREIVDLITYTTNQHIRHTSSTSHFYHVTHK